MTPFWLRAAQQWCSGRRCLGIPEWPCVRSWHNRPVCGGRSSLELDHRAAHSSGIARIGGHPIALAAAALLLIVAGVASIAAWRIYTGHSPETDRALGEAVGSFRRMSIAETEQAKPLRLRIVTVTPGDTVEKLAGKMAVADRALDRFRVLNGLDPGDKLKSGSEVKIVVE